MEMREVTKKWTTKDGSKLKICDMTTTHIKNCIKLLDRAFRREMDLSWGGLSSLQGEMACYYAEGAVDAAEREGPVGMYPIYEDLQNELQRREEGEWQSKNST